MMLNRIKQYFYEKKHTHEEWLDKEADKLLSFYIEEVLGDGWFNYNKRTLARLKGKARTLVEIYGVRMAKQMVKDNKSLENV